MSNDNEEKRKPIRVIEVEKPDDELEDELNRIDEDLFDYRLIAVIPARFATNTYTTIWQMDYSI